MPRSTCHAHSSSTSRPCWPPTAAVSAPAKADGKLTPFRQALLVLRWFRDRTRVDRPRHQSGHRLPLLHEEIDVIAAAAPDLHEALTRCAQAGLSHVVLDGKLIPTDRVATTTEAGNDLWYSGKHKRFGGNIQYLAAPDGFPIWTSDVEPGSVHDLTAARAHVLDALYWAYSQLGLPSLADKGYTGAGIGVHVPRKNPADGRHLGLDNRTYNRLLTATRCLAERAIALLVTRWRALTHVTLCPQRIGAIVRAALVLTQFEHSRSY